MKRLVILVSIFTIVSSLTVFANETELDKLLNQYEKETTLAEQRLNKLINESENSKEIFLKAKLKNLQRINKLSNNEFINEYIAHRALLGGVTSRFLMGLEDQIDDLDGRIEELENKLN